MDHIIATVNSVVHNNLLYKNDETTLTDVFISCLDETMEEVVINYFRNNPVNGINFEDI